MRTLRSSIILITAVALLLVSGEGYRKELALAVEPCDTTSDPCFTNVSDILQVRRILLPVDDLVIPSTTGGNTINFILQTTSSQISGQSTDQVPLVVERSATAVGRMFDLPR